MGAGEWINKAKQFAQGHKDQVQGALDKAGEAVSAKTGGKYDDKLAKGRSALESSLGLQDGAQGGTSEAASPTAGGSDTAGAGMPGADPQAGAEDFGQDTASAPDAASGPAAGEDSAGFGGTGGPDVAPGADEESRGS